MSRTFETVDAKRSERPLLLALIGPSGSGKTYSALRLATGIQRVQPGPIHVIDTESKRSEENADFFQFKILDFKPPFGSLDYLAAIEHTIRQGARTIIIDSMSHEHEGAGGLLEQVESEVQRKISEKRESGDRTPDWKLEQKFKMSAFIRPKMARGKLIQRLTQLRVNVIMCFRAKDKIEIGNDGKPNQQGWMPIGGDEFWYEMNARAILYPGANGVPTWQSELPGEKFAMRRPRQFERILTPGRQISEEMGEEMARWAMGPSAAPASLDAVIASMTSASNMARLGELARSQRGGSWSAEERARIKEAIDRRTAELKDQPG